MFRKARDFFAANPLAALAIMAVVVTGIHLLTIREYPPAWFDEIEILEMGRFSIFDVKPEWSVNLMPLPDGTLAPPCPYFHYLAGALLEALYRLTGGFICGRILMLMSLPCCAITLFAYLRAKAISPMVAFIIASIFLVDPNMTICAHWYRPDLWCMAMVFTSLTLIIRSRASSRPTHILFVSGILAATSLFFWITSILFMPLVLLEFFIAFGKKQDGKSSCQVLPGFAALSIGGIVATAIILVPLFRFIPEIVDQYLSASEIGGVATVSDAPLSAAILRICDFAKIACRSPFTWFAATVGIFLSRRQLAHSVIFAGLAAFLIATRVYHLRMVYLMPYVFLFTAMSVERLACSRSRIASALTKTYVVCALAFGVAISVVAMNFAAWPETNTLSLLSKKIKSSFAAEVSNVCLYDFEHELYYAGRQLGWRMYSTSSRNLILEEPYAAILDKMDVVITSSMMPPLTDDMLRTLRAHGFKHKTFIEMPPSATGRIKPFLANIFYAHGYPSFTVWQKTR